MALKEYRWNGGTYQFNDDDVPKGAVPVGDKAAKPAENKQRTPRNKAASKPAAKPAEPKPQTPAGGVEDATDPGASE